MKLTGKQKEEILRYLDKDDNKPLPEEYRFLLFGDKRQVELVWNGKSHEVCDAVLPFQTIEQVDEPRKIDVIKDQAALFNTGGRQLAGWSNKLIWGDNKLILSSLVRGPMRRQIEEAGGLKLIYIDPPFDVGADFKMNISINGENYTKEPGVIEELAYRDTWGKGADSYIAMMYERIRLMHQLLAEDGSIYVHCDWRVNSYLRLILDEIFGRENYRNEIAWHHPKIGVAHSMWTQNIDLLLFYVKNKEKYNFKYQVLDKPNELFKRYEKFVVNNKLTYGSIKHRKDGAITSKINVAEKLYGRKLRDEDVVIDFSLDENKKRVDNYWKISFVKGNSSESVDYPTQKPIALLERIIKASSNKGDLVADFFCGSGTTAEAAEKLERKWLCCDLGKFALHTTRKRMIETQRTLRQEDKPYRAFQFLNLGKYERQHYIGVSTSLTEDEQKQQLVAKEKEYLELILNAYRAEPAVTAFPFHGKKNGRLVAVGPINMPVSRELVNALVDACVKRRIYRMDVLGFEFETGVFPEVLAKAKKSGIDLKIKYIPRDVFDKHAVERNGVIFYDMAHIEIKVNRKKREDGKTSDIQVELTNFVVYYSQESVISIEREMSEGGKAEIAMEKGKIYKIVKDEKGIVRSTPLITEWTGWVDYWSVDFNFESRPETIRILDEKTGKEIDQPTGNYIFENEWQTFRTKEHSKLEFKTNQRQVEAGKRLKIAVKVVDIFGNDTMHVEEIVT